MNIPGCRGPNGEPNSKARYSQPPPDEMILLQRTPKHCNASRFRSRRGRAPWCSQGWQSERGAIGPRAERSVGRNWPPDGNNSEFDSAHTRICQKDLMSIVMLHFRRSQKLFEQLAGQSTNPFGPIRLRGPVRGVSTWPECPGALVLAWKSRRTGRHRPRVRRYRGFRLVKARQFMAQARLQFARFGLRSSTKVRRWSGRC